VTFGGRAEHHKSRCALYAAGHARRVEPDLLDDAAVDRPGARIDRSKGGSPNGTGSTAPWSSTA